MQIIRKHNKYFLQFDKGELELSEQQVKKRMERGDKVLDQLQLMEEALPDIDANIKIENTGATDTNDIFSQQSYTSAKYFDHIYGEFKNIYIANKDSPDTINKLKRFCTNAIQKLENDRKSPRTDHVIIDYYILSWNAVIVFLDTLPDKIKNENFSQSSEINQGTATVTNDPVATQKKFSKDFSKQLLIIQLMQADGLFPINDAIEGVTQADVHKLIAGMLDLSIDATHQALHQAASILLKRNITPENISARIKLLEEVEVYFEELPYTNIISRVKLLLKLYHEKQMH